MTVDSLSTRSLGQLTTLRLGGPATSVVGLDTDADLMELVSRLDRAGEPLLLLGGGSNVVASDDGFPGTVGRIRTTGLRVDARDLESGEVHITVPAGENWDDVVLRAVAEQWSGIEALAGIPGSVGATPMQNVGAYGQDVSQTIVSVRVFDRQRQQIRTFANNECGFGYRTSRFKGRSRYVVLDVTFRLGQSTLSAPVRYAELARILDVGLGERVAAAEVREAVLELRTSKGMVLDAADHDTWSAGSFFTNPLLETATAASLPQAAPRFEDPSGLVKTSAGWLIERAGFRRGHLGPGGRVSVSTKHTLALTNRGAGTTADLLALARELRSGVLDTFGVQLDAEPVLVGCSL